MHDAHQYPNIGHMVRPFDARKDACMMHGEVGKIPKKNRAGKLE